VEDENLTLVKTCTLFEDPRDILLSETEHNTVERHRHKCPKLNGKVNNENLIILIDSGAELSCISTEFYERIKSFSPVPELPVVGITVVGVTGKKSKPIRKQCFIKLCLEDNGEREVCLLVVDNLAVPVVLGADWLHFFKAKIEECHLEIIEEGGASIVPFHFDGEESKESFSFKINIESGLNGTSEDTKVRVSSAYVQQRLQAAKHRIQAQNNDNKTPSIEDIVTLINNIPDIDTQQRNSLVHMLVENINVFSTKPGLVKGYEHEIKVTETTAFTQYQYPVPLALQAGMDKAIEEMCNWGIIKRASSPYINPIHPIAKGESVRPVLDARRLNKILVPDRERPVPPEEILQKF
jgi:hypothetical protein